MRPPTCFAGRSRACGGDRGDAAPPWILRGEWRVCSPAEGGARLSVTLLHAAGSTVALALEDYKPFADEDSGGGEGKAMAWMRKLAEMARSKDRASRLQVQVQGEGAARRNASMRKRWTPCVCARRRRGDPAR